MECPICKSSKIRKKYSNFPGYIEETFFDIFECTECDVQFIDSGSVGTKIYEIIYSQKNTPGYERYFEYMKEIKRQRDPLRYLVKRESIYFPVYKHLKDKSGLRILEIGCGRGYLTYSLNFSGHLATGIDVSEEAIKSARENFGNYFEISDIENYKTNDKFDLIISTEVIEHVPNPDKFLSACIRLLKKTGAILLTTPNKDYQNKASVWKSECPPVHTFWFSKKSIRILAKMHGMACRFINPQKSVFCSQNKLSCYFLSRKNKLPLPILDKNGKPFEERERISNSSARIIARNFLEWAPVRYLSNLIMINSEPPHFGVILWKAN